MKFRIIISFLLSANLLFAQKAKIDFLPDQPYDKYELKTQKDTLTFYLSVTSHKENLPLIVYVQGSGMNSLFENKNGQIVATSGHMTWFNAGKEKYRCLVVEKPGVNYLQKGTSTAFDKKFSLENWSNTIVTAINYVVQNEKIDTNKILLAGHSEGGVVASRVANLMQDKISNVAIMAGEGPSQIYSLYKFADEGIFFNTKEHNMPTAAERINYLKEKWSDILADPTNTDKKFWGFTYLRWSSFSKTSVIDELANYNGKILILQGTADKAVYPESAIVSYTSLLSKGKNINLIEVANADHSLNMPDQPEIDGWQLVIEKIINWFNP
ncbi:MAG: hypothetical protein EOP54_13450 [Sphingobacteriales bacterium]|nr:MAG: hypothetical protein EOP54_13450 [Sphingobacteriales bacterium]